MNRQNPKVALQNASVEFNRLLSAFPADNTHEFTPLIKDAITRMRDAFAMPRNTEDQIELAQTAIREANVYLREQVERLQNETTSVSATPIQNALLELNARAEKLVRTNKNIHQEFRDILRQLEGQQAHFEEEFKLKGKPKKDPFVTLVSLFRQSEKSNKLTSQPGLDQAVMVINQLYEQIADNLLAKHPTTEAHNRLQELEEMCDRAIENLKAREGFMASFHAEYHLVDYAGTDADFQASYPAAKNRYFPGVPSAAGSFGTTRVLDQTQAPTQGITSTRYRIGKMSDPEGTILSDRVDSQGHAKTELLAVPDDIRADKMWEATYPHIEAMIKRDNPGFSLNEFNQLFTQINETARQKGRSITKDDILKHVPNKKYAEHIFKEFYKQYKPNSPVSFEGYTFPNDIFIKIALQQIRSLRQIDPNNPTVVLSPSSLGQPYMKSIELVCAALKIPLVITDAEYMKYNKTVTDKEAKACLKLLESNTSYGYKKNEKQEQELVDQILENTRPRH